MPTLGQNYGRLSYSAEHNSSLNNLGSCNNKNSKMTIRQAVVRDGLIIFAALILVTIVVIAWHWPDTPASPNHINVRWTDGIG